MTRAVAIASASALFAAAGFAALLVTLGRAVIRAADTDPWPDDDGSEM